MPVRSSVVGNWSRPSPACGWKNRFAAHPFPKQGYRSDHQVCLHSRRICASATFPTFLSNFHCLHLLWTSATRQRLIKGTHALVRYFVHFGDCVLFRFLSLYQSNWDKLHRKKVPLTGKFWRFQPIISSSRCFGPMGGSAHNDRNVWQSKVTWIRSRKVREEYTVVGPTILSNSMSPMI